MEVPRLGGQIRAAAASLHHSHSHSHVGSELYLNLHHSSWQRQILNPLSEARAQPWAMKETLSIVIFKFSFNTLLPVDLFISPI